MKKLISVFLALVTVFGTFATVTMASTVMVSAEDEEFIEDSETLSTSLENILTDEGAFADPMFDAVNYAYENAEEKLSTMTLLRTVGDYEMYMQEYSGEVAFVNTKTGEQLFTNPYNLGSFGKTISNNEKWKILSQLHVKYSYNGVEKDLYSYKDAAQLLQIKPKLIKNGIRVEYTIGETLTNRLVPRMISKDRFESMILSKIPEGSDKKRLISYYTEYNPFDVTKSETEVKEIQAAFPITKKFAIYVCEAGIQPKELKELETIIKTYCPLYTYEEMEQDHNDCDYVANDVAPPNFKMALEYTVVDGAIEARLPANGIRFDEATYTLKEVTVLPYMGAGCSTESGYTFIPDGSGALIHFEDVKNKPYSVAGDMYGADYAYHTIVGKNTETMTMPVYGVVEQQKDEETGEVTSAKGYLAIITEGDSMAKIKSDHGGNVHKYNSVFPIFKPRSTDSYNLADSISVGANASWTVTSSRKYSGSYRIRFVMLTDENRAAAAGLGEGEYYECSYVGMAKAYRDYLEGTGQIKRLTKDETGSDMPLYIETFGTMQTVDRVLSFPVQVDVALTTFDNVQTMYNELAEKGVKDVNFKLTGYYNGGLECTYLSKLTWEKAAGGTNGFKNLVNYAKEKDFGVYPEFDFAYVKKTDWFDGVSEKRDLVKSIDDRYMSKRVYDAAMQSFEKDSALAISASAYSYFYEKFDKSYSDYSAESISVSTLGTDLNSDFNTDDPYNREDAKAATTEVLSKLDEKYNVMVTGGNAYAVKYADHIIDIATDSSNFLSARESVPFVTMVLHGYVNYSGSALNMEGDVKASILKSIENGAALYFTLVYGNTTALKESDEYNKYYSVSYEIWKDEMVEYYNEVNEALGDLQTSVVVDHAFPKAERNFGEDEEVEDASLYQTQSGSVVYVEYDNGTYFIINYNNYDIATEEINGEVQYVEALSYVRGTLN